MSTALSVSGITKNFPGVRALNGIDFEVRAGEVHALLGENGAGKSTLMKVLAGIYAPDSGEIRIAGQPVTLPNPLAAKTHGIILIHQELSLVDEMTVAENIYLGEIPTTRFGIVDWQSLHTQVATILKRLNCKFATTDRVGGLSVAMQQMVEIARALTVNAKVVIFDEPTAALTDQEKTVLFEIIRDLQSQGVGIVYISHRLEEVFAIANRITVLRDGEHRGTVVAGETNEDEVTQLMIGRRLDYSRRSEVATSGTTVLAVERLSCGTHFHDISFAVREGEVVGFYGLIGAGRTEVMQTLFGTRTPTSGRILLDGKPIVIDSPRTAIQLGISLVPENRKEQGLVLAMNIRDNIMLPQVAELTAGPFVSNGAGIAIYEMYRDRLSIKATGWQQSVGNLSGGNQQKIVMGKWLAMKPRVLIVDEPTRGIDVGSKAEIHNLIRGLADDGYAIILVSSEMPEVLHVADRVIAMYQGRITKEFTAAEVSEDNLVQAISGSHGKRSAKTLAGS